jgi:hypothetical protein
METGSKFLAAIGCDSWRAMGEKNLNIYSVVTSYYYEAVILILLGVTLGWSRIPVMCLQV